MLPWEWRKRKSREWGGLLLGVGALGFSLRRSQRDPDCWGEIIYVPVTLSRDLGPQRTNKPQVITAIDSPLVDQDTNSCVD